MLGTADQTGRGPVFVGAHPAAQNALIKTGLVNLRRRRRRRRRRLELELELELELALALALASRARARVVGRGGRRTSRCSSDRSYLQWTREN